MLALTNARVIDGTGQPPVTGSTVLIEGRRISRVGQDISIPRSALVIDLQGRTLLPGLIDAHAHLGGRDHPPGLDNATNSFHYAPMRDYTLAAGVTSIRSCGDFLIDSLETRDLVEQGLLRGPRLVCSGKSFQRRDAHPSRTIWGNDPDTCANAGAFPDTPQEARALVREMVEAGVDYVKIIVADSSILIYPAVIPPLADDVMEAIVEESHRLGKWVACHIDSPGDAIKLIGYGADEIDHLISMGLPRLPDEQEYDELFELMIEKGTWFVPTIIIPRVYNHVAIARGALVTVDEYFIPHYRKAYEAGVRMGCGCDSGAPAVLWGHSMHGELAEYVHNLGMTPLEAITCATRNNAVILGIDDQVGTVQEGLTADLLVVSGDPSSRIEDLANIALVLRDGRVVVDRMFSQPSGVGATDVAVAPVRP